MTGTNIILAPNSSVLAGDSNPFLDAAGPGGEAFGDFIKFVKEGKIIDRDKEEVLAPGDVFIPAMGVAKHGWNCWMEAEKVDEHVQMILDPNPFPTKNMLTDHGPYKKYPNGTEDGWTEFYEVPIAVEDDEGSTPYTLQFNSTSAINGFRSLLREYGKKYMTKVGEDGNFMFPVVEFDVSGFVPKADPKAGTIYAPNFKIVDWVEASEVEDYFKDLSGDGSDDPDNYEDDGDEAEAPEPEVEEKPKGRRGKTSVQEAEPQEADDDVDADVETKPKGNARGRRGRRRT